MESLPLVKNLKSITYLRRDSFLIRPGYGVMLKVSCAVIPLGWNCTMLFALPRV